MTAEQIIYVITKGSYSGYHICAVTMDKGRAEKIKEMYSDDWEEAAIEEYIPDEAQKMRKYGVVFDIKGVFQRYKADDDYGFFEVGMIDDYNDDETITIWVEAKDEAHALKIAQDRRAEYLAKEAGIA